MVILDERPVTRVRTCCQSRFVARIYSAHIMRSERRDGAWTSMRALSVPATLCLSGMNFRFHLFPCLLLDHTISGHCEFCDNQVFPLLVCSRIRIPRCLPLKISTHNWSDTGVGNAAFSPLSLSCDQYKTWLHHTNALTTISAGMQNDTYRLIDRRGQMVRW